MRLHKNLWWLVKGCWEAVFLTSEEKKLLEKHGKEEFKDFKSQLIDNGPGRPRSLQSSIIEKIHWQMAVDPWYVRLQRHWKTWSWFFRKEVINWWRGNFKKHWCSHRNLSDPKWEFGKGGYRYCYSCWTEFYDPALKLEDTCNVEEISA